MSRYLRQYDGIPRSELEQRLAKAEAKLGYYEQSIALPGLGWDCKFCCAFNGWQKETLTRCRSCGKEHENRR